jgi:hypothetical protein
MLDSSRGLLFRPTDVNAGLIISCFNNGCYSAHAAGRGFSKVTISWGVRHAPCRIRETNRAVRLWLSSKRGRALSPIFLIFEKPCAVGCVSDWGEL